MNKKLVGIFVSMLMIVTALSVTGNTIFDDEPTDPVVLYDDWSMIVVNTTAEPGDIGHVIPINGTWVEAISSYRVWINYEPTEIEFIGANLDGCVGEGSSLTVNWYSGTVMIAVQSISPPVPPGEGQLINIVFNIITSANPIISELTLHATQSYYYTGGEKIYPTVYDGHIAIGSGTDTTPPVTTCTLDGAMQGDDVYLSSVTATLEATDDGSGVDYTMIKVDDEEYEEYSDPVVISDLGEHTIYFYSVDNSENIEEEQNESFTIALFLDDWSMMVTNTTADPGDIGHVVPIYGIWDENIQKYQLTVGYESSKVEITEINVDGCVGEGGVFIPTYDDHEVSIYVFGFNLPAGAGKLANIVVNITSTTGGRLSDIEFDDARYRIVGESTDIYATRYDGHIRIEGDDVTPPVTTCALSGDMIGDVYISDVSVLLSATDDFSGVNYTMYKIDDGEWNTYEEMFSVSGDGDHTVYFYSVDMDRNEETIKSCPFTIEYDTTPPETTCTLDGEMLDEVYIGPVTVTLEATDDLTGVDYTMIKIDEGDWQTYDDDPVEISESGEHTIYYYSVDNNDPPNTEDEQSTTFTIEYQPELIIESITGGNGITAVIKNIGDGDATDVDWEIVIEGGLIILPKSAEGSFSTIAAGESEEVTMSVIGIGLGIITDIPEITVTAECAEGSSAEGNETASIFIFNVEIQ